MHSLIFRKLFAYNMEAPAVRQQEMGLSSTYKIWREKKKSWKLPFVIGHFKL